MKKMVSIFILVLIIGAVAKITVIASATPKPVILKVETAEDMTMKSYQLSQNASEVSYVDSSKLEKLSCSKMIQSFFGNEDHYVETRYKITSSTIICQNAIRHTEALFLISITEGLTLTFERALKKAGTIKYSGDDTINDGEKKAIFSGFGLDDSGSLLVWSD